MKVLVLSDSHSDTEHMVTITYREKPDVLLHLGDHISDTDALHEQFPLLPLHSVKGNNDFGSDAFTEKTLYLEDKLLYLTHGHFFAVKSGLSRVQEKGRSLHADILLYGHTHRPFLDYINGMWIMNPGSCGRFLYYSSIVSYGILLLKKGNISCNIIHCK